MKPCLLSIAPMNFHNSLKFLKLCALIDVSWLVQDFDTVMAALGSNTERWGIFNVSLVLKRYITSNAPA